jgi:hypothetical protein
VFLEFRANVSKAPAAERQWRPLSEGDHRIHNLCHGALYEFLSGFFGFLVRG